MAYQIKGITGVWYEKCKGKRVEGLVPISWEEFKSASLDHFFSMELREAKIEDFNNHRHGSMSVREYALKYTKLSKYAPIMILNLKARMSKFVMSLQLGVQTV